MFINSRLPAYLLSLVLSFYVYILFSKYLIFEEMMDTGWPYIIFYGANVVFAFLSWFHFYKPKLGSTLLTISIVVMFIIWMIILNNGHFGNYAPDRIETLFLLALSCLTIAAIRTAGDEEYLEIEDKIALSILPFGLVLYLFLHFYFGIL
jgi:hypothetical protein